MAELLGCSVAIVGGGPAGLAAAIALRRRNVGRVIVLERDSEAGGVPRHCGHPPFGIREFGYPMTGLGYARNLRRLALRNGVEIRAKHSVVEVAPHGRLSVAAPDGLVRIEARRVVLATGARETPRAAMLVSGHRPPGVINTGGLQACIYLEQLQPRCRRPVIVGTDLIGLSALWTCLRHGIKPAAIIEKADRAVARWPLGRFPSLAGVPVYFGSQVAAIEGSDRVERAIVQPHRGQSFAIGCDGVVFTGAFLPETALASAAAIEIDPHSGGPAIDQYGRCSDPVVFAAGNVLRPIETSGWCFREGGRIGHAVADDLQGLLPAPASALRVIAGIGVKYVVPQRIFPQGPRSPLRELQIRATRAGHGELRVVQEGDVAWCKRLSTKPERRLLIPLAGLPQNGGCGNFEVVFDCHAAAAGNF